MFRSPMRSSSGSFLFISLLMLLILKTIKIFYVFYILYILIVFNISNIKKEINKKLPEDGRSKHVGVLPKVF